MTQHHVSIYNGVTDRTGIVVSLDAVVNRITTGAKGLDEKTRLLNVLSQTDPEAYSTEKTKLPAVTWSGVFRNRKELITHSGYVVLDFDDTDIGTLLADMRESPHVFFAFVSPSGTGVKAVVPVSPIPTTKEEHKHAFNAVSEAFEMFGDVDPSGSDVTRLCFLAHDAQAIYRSDNTVIKWDPLDSDPIQTPTSDNIETGNFTGNADIDALNYVPNDCDYETWRNIGMALKAAGFGVEVFRKWSGGKRKKSTGVWITEDIDSHWNRYNSTGITYATVLHIARQHGYTPRHNHKPVKLHKRTDIDCVIEPIESTRDLIREAFERDERLIGFRADTGIGKTHETIALYQTTGIRGFFSTPTSMLAKEVEARLDFAECFVFRWRGLHAEQDGEFPHEKPCMFPDEYRAYVESGRDAYQMLCRNCQYLDACEKDGYRSQEAKAKAAQVTVAAHKDLLMDPSFRPIAERILPSGKRDLIAIDEFDVFDAFIRVEVSQARLEYLRDIWTDHPLGDFAKDILQACIIENKPYEGLKSILEGLSSTKSAALIDALASYRIGRTVFTREEAHRIEEDMCQPLDKIQALPRIETVDWNLLVQLELFFERYHQAARAPITWKDNTLAFYLPPLPLYTKAKLLCMSATLRESFFLKAFSTRQEKREDVGFIDANDTAWHPQARVFQLRTNRNPRGTLLNSTQDATGKWKYTGLTDTGQQALDAILQSAAVNTGQHALITYKWIAEKHAEAIANAGIIAGHFGGLAGLDQHFGRDSDAGIVLHVLGAPEVPPHETEHRYNLLYGDSETQRDLTRDSTTGDYNDSDVQAVYEAGVKSEIMQAIGRAGVVKNPSTVILWTSHELPSVSHRDQTQHFDETDWVNAKGCLSTLAAEITAREAAEAAEKETTETGDVRTVMETTGQSKSTVYRQTKAARDQKKAERDAEIIRLHKEGLSLRKIRSELGVGYGTVSRVVKVYQNSQPLYRSYIERGKNGTPPKDVVNSPVESETLNETEPTPRDPIQVSGFKVFQIQKQPTGQTRAIVFTRPPPTYWTERSRTAQKTALVETISSLKSLGANIDEIADKLEVSLGFIETAVSVTSKETQNNNEFLKQTYT